ncbi:MAG: PAS domain S-box protein, partial [Ignavibacteriales bacterium]|nr:PAS domain S-box protein [Ignavibacteriales bacterium]
QKLSKAVMQSPASLIITDTNGKIEFVNKMFTEISGYSWDEAIGKNPRILKSGKMPNHVYEKMWKKISSGKVWNGELLNKKKDGTLYWENVTISPITNSEGEIINLLGVKEDITEAKKNKLILTEAKEKAEQSDKLKSEFLAQMSHEIRTPVNSILSFSNLLKQDFFNEDNEELSLIFNSIDSASKRIIRTIEMIINMAEIQSGSYDVCFKEIDFIEKILDPLILEYKMIAELRGLKLIYESDANSKKNIVLDEYSATQIFTNLLDNAIKYTVKGFIKVTVKLESESRLNVEISDSGIGMSTEYLNKLFLPFTQEEQGYSRKFDGNGLGLALVKNYCELNGASIEVKSKKNLGSTFIIKFKK